MQGWISKQNMVLSWWGNDTWHENMVPKIAKGQIFTVQKIINFIYSLPIGAAQIVADFPLSIAAVNHHLNLN